MRKALIAAGYDVTAAEISLVPKATVTLEGGDAEQVLKLLDRLEDLDDVQKVYSNADFSDEAVAAFSA